MPRRTRFEARSGLDVQSLGDGRTVVLLHGWCLNRALWMYTEDALARDFRVVSPDLAGFGASGSLDGSYGLDRHAGDLIDLLDELGVDDAIVVGFAFGAAVAITAAVSNPARMSGTISIGIPSAACSPYGKMARSIRRDWPDFARRSARALCANPQSDATLTWIESMFVRTRLPVALEALAALELFEPEPIAPQVRVPTLYVHADKDEVAPQQVGRACAAASSDGRFELVGDCGHLIVIDRKDDFNVLLRQQLISWPDRGAS